MAHDSANVNFEEGSLTINRQNSNVLSQEQNFEDTVGQRSIAMAEGIIIYPVETHPMIWRAASGIYIEGVLTFYSNFIISEVVTPASSWTMSRSRPISQDQFDPT
ncbi:hypothetical protein FSARC_12395 [Fusarium sarcochroum]|uniref:Uncharacterized protein n=1 Tax=Fusarium sarcochroum TaxID=1208366 RepID=A0A8H4T8Y6_9HYPO|nr:hypothetical protein FSARC_12395 [Fusarium sarcochroum]